MEVKVIDLPPADLVAGTDILLLEQNSGTKNTTVTKLISDLGLVTNTTLAANSAAQRIGTKSGNSVQVELDKIELNATQTQDEIAQVQTSVAEIESKQEAFGNTVQEELNNNLLNDREQWRRSLVETGLTLVDGSFEEGASVQNDKQAVWYIAGGQCYVWGGLLPKTVYANSTPLTTGGISAGAWVSVGDTSLRQELAAPGGAALVGPGVMSRGLDKFSIMQGRDGDYRQDTLTRGLSVELNETISGIGFAGATNTYMFNRFLIADDKVDAVNDGTPGSKVDGLIVQHDFGGAGSRGGRHAAEFMLTQKGVTESDNTDRNYVGVVGYCATNTGDGGTSDTDKKGAYFGGNFFTTIKNAPFVSHANGCESNVLIDANSSVYYRAGYTAVSGGVNQATKYDAAYAVGALGTSGAQWKDGLLVGVQNGRNPVSRSIIRGESVSVPRILSFSGTIPTEIVVSDSDERFNFRVDALKMHYNNASLSLGSKTAANTPFIAAYTDASGNRAGRIIFTGTAVSEDNGVCNIQFRQTTVRELVPSSAATFNCGANSLPWAGGFTQSAFTVTSDERHKGKPLILARGNLAPAATSDAGMMESPYTDKILDAWAEVNFVQFQYLDRVEEKGEDGARWHFGVVAQRAKEAFERHGLDAHRFGFLCYDEWGDSPAVIDEDTGDVTTPAIKAGSRYGIRYEEALVLEAALQRRNYKEQKLINEELFRRIEALEAK